MQQQLARLLRFAPGDGADGVEGVEQKVGIDLGLHQLELGLHQQSLLLLQPAGQQLLGEQVGNPFPRVWLILRNSRFLGS